MNETADINNQILESLNALNESSVKTNNSLKELQEYFIAKDRQEEQAKETQAKQVEQDSKKLQEIQDQANKESESRSAEAEAREQEQAETYTELLTDIRSQITLSNEIMTGQIMFTGIICGILLAKIFIDRFMKL